MAGILVATLLGFLVGLAGTVCGGGIVLLRAHPSRKEQAGLLGLSGGIMLAVVLFDLWPGAWLAGGFRYLALGTGLGVFLLGGLDRLLPHLPGLRGRGVTRFARTGMLIGLGISSHNFPEGVALGTAFTATGAVFGWLGLALLMGLHNVPEGMVMAATLRLGRIRLQRILWALVLVEVPMALGAAVGGICGRLAGGTVAAALAFAGGAMFYVVVKELIPAGGELGGYRVTGWGMLGGVVLGTVLAMLV